jgi:hypothetical protein
MVRGKFFVLCAVAKLLVTNYITYCVPFVYQILISPPFFFHITLNRNKFVEIRIQFSLVSIPTSSCQKSRHVGCKLDIDFTKGNPILDLTIKSIK